MAMLPEHKELLLTQSESKTLLQWYNFFNQNYSKRAISSFCYRNNIKTRKYTAEEYSQLQSQNARKYHINQDFFKCWSHNMAYVLGLWFADGCIYGGKMFDITLHNKDKYILKRIAELLEYEGNIQDCVDKQAARINFSCVVIYKDIIALGGTENKSMTIQFPNIPEEYLPDFIRGYFDGDGSVMNVKGGRINTAFTCGSKEFLDTLVEVLKSKAGVEGGSYDARNYTYKFGDKDSIKIGKYIYQNNPELFLLRKKKKFNKI